MLTAITGGIGSGKSIVSKILAAMGYPVYDCDSQAKLLMDQDDQIKKALCSEIHADCVRTDGSINRERLSEIVFGDAGALCRLNAIVHAAVRLDLKRWCGANIGSGRLFVETAILYQSGLDVMVDDVWSVDAPAELRIERVMARNSFSRQQVEARIASQDSYVPTILHPRVFSIINDGCIPLLPQIENLLGQEMY